MTLLPETLRGAKEYSDVVYGAILLGALMLAPKGIVGSLASLVRTPAQRQGGAAMSLLALDNVSVSFGGVAAVRGVTMRVEAGEIHGLIGPNGAGKTSLINAITGIVRPASGAIAFAEQAITALAPDLISARGIGRTFQHVELFREETVLDNVLTGLYSHHVYGVAAAIVGFGRARRVEDEARREARRCSKPSSLLRSRRRRSATCRSASRSASRSDRRLKGEMKRYFPSCASAPARWPALLSGGEQQMLAVGARADVVAALSPARRALARAFAEGVRHDHRGHPPHQCRGHLRC